MRGAQRMTRTVAFVVLSVYLIAAFIAATAAQFLGMWVWAPKPDAALAFAAFVAAAYVAILWIPAEDLDDPDDFPMWVPR